MTDLFARRGRAGELPAVVDMVVVGDCWEWQGNVSTDGYGRVEIDGRAWLVHRLFYEALVGPIPDGLQIDHLCRNRSCVNPDHLEPVTMQENIRRGAPGAWERRQRRTHCKKGHRYDGHDGVKRYCSVCRRNSKRRYEERVRRECQGTKASSD